MTADALRVGIEMGCESFAAFDMLALQAHRPATKAFVPGADMGAAITIGAMSFWRSYLRRYSAGKLASRALRACGHVAGYDIPLLECDVATRTKLTDVVDGRS